MFAMMPDPNKNLSDADYVKLGSAIRQALA